MFERRCCQVFCVVSVLLLAPLLAPLDALGWFTASRAPMLSREAVAIPFMPGVSLNVTREALLKQEGVTEGALHATRTTRPVEPGIALHEVIGQPLRGALKPATVKGVGLIGRKLFGWELFQYAYYANPHTGRFDMLNANLCAARASKSSDYADFIKVRDALKAKLPPPEVEGLVVNNGTPMPKDAAAFDAASHKGHARALAVWHRKGLFIRLMTSDLTRGEWRCPLRLTLTTTDLDIMVEQRDQYAEGLNKLYSPAPLRF